MEAKQSVHLPAPVSEVWKRNGTSGEDAANTTQGIFQAGFDNLQKLFGTSSGQR